MSYKIINDVYVVYCPLFKKDIDMGLCSDICSATRRILKKECVPEIKDWDEAKRECSKCENKD